MIRSDTGRIRRLGWEVTFLLGPKEQQSQSGKVLGKRVLSRRRVRAKALILDLELELLDEERKVADEDKRYSGAQIK